MRRVLYLALCVLLLSVSSLAQVPVKKQTFDSTATAATPAAGKGVLWGEGDNGLKYKSSNGVEHNLSSPTILGFSIGCDSSVINETDKIPAQRLNPIAVTIDSVVYWSWDDVTPNLVPKLFYATDPSQAGTAIRAIPSAVTAYHDTLKVGDVVVPAGQSLFATFPTVTIKPSKFLILVYVHE